MNDKLINLAEADIQPKSEEVLWVIAEQPSSKQVDIHIVLLQLIRGQVSKKLDLRVKGEHSTYLLITLGNNIGPIPIQDIWCLRPLFHGLSQSNLKANWRMSDWRACSPRPRGDLCTGTPARKIMAYWV
jgi:hypothetical protein